MTEMDYEARYPKDTSLFVNNIRNRMMTIPSIELLNKNASPASVRGG